MVLCQRKAADPFFARLKGIALIAASVLALSGCGALPLAVQDRHETSPYGEEQLGAPEAVHYWSERYTQDPKDKHTAISYASHLRAAGQTKQAAEVMQQVAIQYPDDPKILGAFAKTLAANRDYQRALNVINNTIQRDNPDWSLLSTEAAIYDQMGEHDQARRIYQQALVLAPGEPSILNNLGMSYILTGQLADAEAVLHQASQHAKADTQVRQNLALALGLQGKFADAEAILKRELPAEQANRNIAYLRDMLSQPNNWKKLGEIDGIDGKGQIGLRLNGDTALGLIAP